MNVFYIVQYKVNKFPNTAKKSRTVHRFYELLQIFGKINSKPVAFKRVTGEELALDQDTVRRGSLLRIPRQRSWTTARTWDSNGWLRCWANIWGWWNLHMQLNTISAASATWSI